MVEGNNFTTVNDTPGKQSLWQRFKSMSLVKKIGTVLVGLFLVSIISSIVNPGGAEERREQREQEQAAAEEERLAEEAREAEEEAEAEREAEEERLAEEEAEAEEERLAEEEAEEEAEREEMLANPPAYIEQNGPPGARDAEIYEFEGTLYVSYRREVVLGDPENALASDAHMYIEEAWEVWQPEWQRMEILATNPVTGGLWHNAGFSAGSVELIATENTVIYETLNLRDTGVIHFD
jgi:hypothetical protein